MLMIQLHYNCAGFDTCMHAVTEQMWEGAWGLFKEDSIQNNQRERVIRGGKGLLESHQDDYREGKGTCSERGKGD